MPTGNIGALNIRERSLGVLHLVSGRDPFDRAGGKMELGSGRVEGVFHGTICSGSTVV
jgi:hypothetical protein